MDTDQLIRTLAADNAHRARPVGFVLALALLAAAPVSLLMFFAELGVRPDVMTAMHNPFFDLKFAVTLALAIAAIAVSLHLSRPEASLRGWGWLLLIPAGLLAAGDRRRDDDAAAAADDDAAGRQQFADLHDGDPADVAAAAGRRADRACATARRRGRRSPAPSPDCCRRDWRRRFTPRTAPTIRRCSWRPGTRIATALVAADRRAGGVEVLRY